MKTLFITTLLILELPLFGNTALAETEGKGWNGEER